MYVNKEEQGLNMPHGSEQNIEIMEENCLNIQAGKTEEIQRIISPTTWKYLQRGYFFSRWLALHPYEWDEATNRPKVATGFFRIFFWHLHLLSAIIFYGILVYRCVQVTVLQPGSRLEQMYVLFLAAFYSLFIVSQMHAAFKRYEIVNWIQGFFLLTTKCEGNDVEDLISFSFSESRIIIDL